MRSLGSAFLIGLIACSAQAEPSRAFDVSDFALTPSTRRRAAVRPISPGQWLRTNSIALTSTDLTDDDSDLLPLKTWLSGVRIVGLGDGTHGTHEYYTVKKRLIHFLAREDGITLVTFEAPWAEFNKITHYLLTGEGNPRELLRIGGYFFWEYQEMLDVVTWARTYNETRGAKPPLRFLGVDILPFGSKTDVLAFFQQVDPSYHATATSKYSCSPGTECLGSAREVRQRLIDNRQRYEEASSAARFRDVLQSARVVEQYLERSTAPAGKGDEYRDRFIAENVSTVLAMYEPGARALFWGHNEHVGKNFYELSEDPSLNDATRSAGSFLREQFGDEYYVLGSCFLNGSFTAYELVSQGVRRLTAHAMEPPAADNYESLFKEAALPRMIINFRVASVPDFLNGPRRLRHGQASFGNTTKGYNVPVRLLEKFDGMIYLDVTTPTVPLP